LRSLSPCWACSLELIYRFTFVLSPMAAQGSIWQIFGSFSRIRRTLPRRVLGPLVSFHFADPPALFFLKGERSSPPLETTSSGLPPTTQTKNQPIASGPLGRWNPFLGDRENASPLLFVMSVSHLRTAKRVTLPPSLGVDLIVFFLVPLFPSKRKFPPSPLLCCCRVGFYREFPDPPSLRSQHRVSFPPRLAVGLLLGFKSPLYNVFAYRVLPPASEPLRAPPLLYIFFLDEVFFFGVLFSFCLSWSGDGPDSLLRPVFWLGVYFPSHTYPLHIPAFPSAPLDSCRVSSRLPFFPVGLPLEFLAGSRILAVGLLSSRAPTPSPCFRVFYFPLVPPSFLHVFHLCHSATRNLLPDTPHSSCFVAFFSFFVFPPSLALFPFPVPVAPHTPLETISCPLTSGERTSPESCFHQPFF